MKAIVYDESVSLDSPDALTDTTLPEPEPTGHDLLVEVHSVSVNPVDTKIRGGVLPPPVVPKVLGWDASGVVRAVGDKVTLFKPGDRVMYAGSLIRAGTNSELHLVDERIVGPMPKSLSFEEAAALPLTSITAWELLFDRLQVREGKEPIGILLVIGGAGGVGSILIQLAPADRPDRGRHRIAAGNTGVGARAWCAPCDRPHGADARAVARHWP